MTSLRFHSRRSTNGSKNIACLLSDCCQSLPVYRNLFTSWPKAPNDTYLNASDVGIAYIQVPNLVCRSENVCPDKSPTSPTSSLSTVSRLWGQSRLTTVVRNSSSSSHKLNCDYSSTRKPTTEETIGFGFNCQKGDTFPVDSSGKLDVHKDFLSKVGPKSCSITQSFMGLDPPGLSGNSTACRYRVNYSTNKSMLGTILSELLVTKSLSNSHNLPVSHRRFSSEPITELTVVTERLVTSQDVEAYARLTGDTNPVHFSGKPIVHGALLNSFLSGVIGTKLPGPGTILVSQAFKFPHPCHIDDVIVIRVSVADVRKISVCKYRISRKSDDKTLMEGEAKVIVRKTLTINAV